VLQTLDRRSRAAVDSLGVTLGIALPALAIAIVVGVAVALLSCRAAGSR
jgi:flagellar biosynthesis protein FliQ